jgi:tetratricopeptide (TPR) repeat protein
MSSSFQKAKSLSKTAYKLYENLDYPISQNETLLIKEKFELAISFYTKAIAENPGYRDAYLERAELYWIEIISNETACFDDLYYLQKLNPESHSIHSNIASKWLYLNQFEKSIEHYLEALKLCGKFESIGILHFHIGEAYIQTKNYQEAFIHILESIEFLDDTQFLPIDAFYYKGLCLQKMGYIISAQSAYVEFCKLQDTILYKDFPNYLEE